MNVWTDVALDPYSDQGHDGMVSSDKRGDGGRGRILNDETIEQLCRQAICQVNLKFTCFNGTKVQILMQLLVQKHKY